MPTDGNKKKKKSKESYSPKISRDPKFNMAALVVVVLGLGVAGYFILFSRAASNNSSVEAENGQLSGSAASVSDSTASAGKYVRFGQVTSATGPTIPAKSYGTCPTFANGDVSIAGRQVVMYMDNNAATSGGPLIFVWHGQYGDPAAMVNYTFGNANTIEAIKNAGGIVVAPRQQTTGSWSYFSGWTDDKSDAKLVDEVTACAIEKNLVAKDRIHMVGMSLGGFNTAHLAYLRSNYIASAVVMSGGLSNSDYSDISDNPAIIQNQNNKFATIVFHGMGNGEAFENGSTIKPAVMNYYNFAKSKGQFTIMCDHKGGHVVPTQAAAGIKEFFDKHPFGVKQAYNNKQWPSTFPSTWSCSN